MPRSGNLKRAIVAALDKMAVEGKVNQDQLTRNMSIPQPYFCPEPAVQKSGLEGNVCNLSNLRCPSAKAETWRNDGECNSEKSLY